MQQPPWKYLRSVTRYVQVFQYFQTSSRKSKDYYSISRINRWFSIIIKKSYNIYEEGHLALATHSQQLFLQTLSSCFSSFFLSRVHTLVGKKPRDHWISPYNNGIRASRQKEDSFINQRCWLKNRGLQLTQSTVVSQFFFFSFENFNARPDSSRNPDSFQIETKILSSQDLHNSIICPSNHIQPSSL